MRQTTREEPIDLTQEVINIDYDTEDEEDWIPKDFIKMMREAMREEIRQALQEFNERDRQMQIN